MKRIMTVFLALLTLMSLMAMTACGGDEEEGLRHA